MSSQTCLQPLAPERARELVRLMAEVQPDAERALALDDEGYVTGIVDVDDAAQEHLLGDLDVHA